MYIFNDIMSYVEGAGYALILLSGPLFWFLLLTL
jgi:hypothetical protein